MELRTIQPSEIEQAGSLFYQAFAATAKPGGHSIPWLSERHAVEALSRDYELDSEASVVAVEGGAIVGVGSMRVRGDVASIGPVAVAASGRGIGSAVVDELLDRADTAGARATRLHVEAWNTGAYALFASRGFHVVDVVTKAQRSDQPPPVLGTSRGLEVRPFREADLDEVCRFDRKLSGHDRRRELEVLVALVAFRHGSLVGYLGVTGGSLGPALAVDASDLFTLVAHQLASQSASSVEARVSTAAPATTMALTNLGFSIVELGVILSRGAPPPARPPQIYSTVPELL